MGKSAFVYVTYIRTTQEKLWAALTDSAFIEKYWMGRRHESDWKVGASWQLILTDGRIGDTGEIVELDAPKRLVIKWRNEFRPELKAEGYSRFVAELEPAEGAIKLTITHSIELDESKFVTAVSGGWPLILSNLKSLLETGSPLLEKTT